MSILIQNLNDKLRGTINGLQSPRSVARAFRQYLADKTAIAARQISLIAETVSLSNPDMTYGESHSKVTDLMSDANMSTNSVILAGNGRHYSLFNLLQSLMTRGDFDNIKITDITGNHLANIDDIIDNLVDSFQSVKVFEASFASLQVDSSSSFASISDISNRLMHEGIDLTTRASTTLLLVSDIVQDRGSSVIDKISNINKLIMKGSESIENSNVDDGIQLPDIDPSNYQGASPLTAMLQDIDIDIMTPVSAIVSGVKAAWSVSAKMFKAVERGLAAGWNWLTTKIDHNMINPVDFYIANEDADSKMVDVPFIDQEFTLTGNIIDSTLTLIMDPAVRSSILQSLLSQEVGSMLSTYTPYAVINLYKSSPTNFRLIGHLIPTAPLKSNGDTDWLNTISEAYKGSVEDGEVYEDWTDGINCTPGVLMDRHVLNQSHTTFNHGADDDAYYASSLASSLVRLDIMVANALLVTAAGEHFSWVTESTMNSTFEELFDDGRLFDTDFVPSTYAFYSGATIRDEYLGVTKSFGLIKPSLGGTVFADAISGNLISNNVTNAVLISIMRDFVNLDENVALARLLVFMFSNSQKVMEIVAEREGEVPAFIPTVFENQYQIPTYAIATDGKNGDKIARIFTGIIITAVVLTIASFAIPKMIAVKRAMLASQLTINGLQRSIENMDPSDPSYMDNLRQLIKMKRNFKMKNAFLSLVGMGATKSATSALKGNQVFELNKDNSDVISLIK